MYFTLALLQVVNSLSIHFSHIRNAIEFICMKSFPASDRTRVFASLVHSFSHGVSLTTNLGDSYHLSIVLVHLNPIFSISSLFGGGASTFSITFQRKGIHTEDESFETLMI
jgi:hypothetical protein